MTKKVYNKKYNKLLSPRNHYYGFGDAMTKVVGNIAGNPDKDGNITTGAFKGMSGAASSLFSGLTSAVGGVVGNAIGGGFQSGAGKAIGALGNIASAIPGPWGAAVGAGLQVVGGLANRAFGSKMNEENIAEVEGDISKLNNFKTDTSSFDTLADTWGSTALGSNFSNSFIGKDGWFANKAAKKAKELRHKLNMANAFVENSLENNAENITENTMNNLEANYAAFGGSLNTAGANFPTGLLFIDEGGTHESNPYEGIPMGIAPDGKPNLVEEGEVIYNDYVFSNRLTVPKAIRSKYKLKGTKNMTFADAAKQMTKSNVERPNDHISKETLHEIMSDLVLSQETMKQKNKIKEEHKFWPGGFLDEYDRPILSIPSTSIDQSTRIGSLDSIRRNLRHQPDGMPLQSIPQEGINGLLPLFNSKYSELPNAGVPKTSLSNIPSKIDYAVPITVHPASKAIPSDEEEDEETKLDLGTSNESLRYAPAIGLGLSTLSDAVGLTNKPDYSEAAMVEAATKGGSYTPVSWTPIGNKLTYRPFDRNYYTNKLNASAGATRRAIANQSGSNRGRAVAGILAADYNAQNQLGDLFRKAEEYNLDQRMKVEDFNRATNQANAQGMLQADMANQSAYANSRDFNLKGMSAAAEMRNRARLASEQAKSTNLSNFLQTLGDIGYENKGMNMIRRLAEANALGTISKDHPLYKLLVNK